MGCSPSCATAGIPARHDFGTEPHWDNPRAAQVRLPGFSEPALVELGVRVREIYGTDRRRRCFVEPADGGGKARWRTGGVAGLGYELTRAMRDVLLGADPPVRLTRRAADRLAEERELRSHLVHPGGTVIVRDERGDLRWWTWAGFRANATLAATRDGHPGRPAG